MLLNERGHQGTIGRKRVDGSRFIVAHEAAVALHIGTEDSGELTLHTPLPAGDYLTVYVPLSNDPRLGGHGRLLLEIKQGLLIAYRAHRAIPTRDKEV